MQLIYLSLHNFLTLSKFASKFTLNLPLNLPLFAKQRKSIKKRRRKKKEKTYSFRSNEREGSRCTRVLRQRRGELPLFNASTVVQTFIYEKVGV